MQVYLVLARVGFHALPVAFFNSSIDATAYLNDAVCRDGFLREEARERIQRSCLLYECDITDSVVRLELIEFRDGVAIRRFKSSSWLGHTMDADSKEVIV